MKLVAVTDIHGNSRKTRELAGVLEGEEFDAILVAGDITHFGNSREAERVLIPLLDTGRPVLAVHGNCDGRDVPELLEELGIGLHDRRREIGGIGVTGIGGSNLTPFGTVWELGEDEIRGILKRNYREGDVILSHVPPYGTKVDRVRSGLHAGSRALRDFIERKSPRMVVCGHIHEGTGIDRVGETLVVNPGPLFRGHYAVLELGKGIKVELRKL
ncbi:metallophosphoesterase [Thermococcus sp. P6]|uniref:metallophosphoesterase n=1 Tax=Thermococcus sp. P6 TaxID=122420 RepID=UPI000B59A1F4|nr:metallophosphoesterase [Thermococcus sp. P6]ASJ10771.1 metallophosphoesterase [Thermococcus sp. P6]